MHESDSGGEACDYTMTGVKEDTSGAYGTSENILKAIGQIHAASDRL